MSEDGPQVVRVRAFVYSTLFFLILSTYGMPYYQYNQGLFRLMSPPESAVFKWPKITGGIIYMCISVHSLMYIYNYIYIYDSMQKPEKHTTETIPSSELSTKALLSR